MTSNDDIRPTDAVDCSAPCSGLRGLTAAAAAQRNHLIFFRLMVRSSSLQRTTTTILCFKTRGNPYTHLETDRDTPWPASTPLHDQAALTPRKWLPNIIKILLNTNLIYTVALHLETSRCVERCHHHHVHPCGRSFRHFKAKWPFAF